MAGMKKKILAKVGLDADSANCIIRNIRYDLNHRDMGFVTGDSFSDEEIILAWAKVKTCTDSNHDYENIYQYLIGILEIK